MSSLLLSHADFLIADSDSIVEDGSVRITDHSISAAGPAVEVAAEGAADEEIDCRGCIVFPGLVNAHNHIYEIMQRGLGKDYEVLDWVRHAIYPITKVMTAEDFYWSNVVAIADAFRNGTTGLVEHPTNFVRFYVDNEFQALVDCGIRGAVYRTGSNCSTVDPEENAPPDVDLRQSEEYVTKWQGHPLVRPGLGPSGFHCADADLFSRYKDLARRKQAPFHFHLAENPYTTAAVRKLGYRSEAAIAHAANILDENTSLAHCVWLGEADFEVIRSSGAQVCHNASSNQILASGIPNIMRMFDKGIPIALGSDGPASNDSMDMIGEMKAAALLQRVNTLDPTALSARDVFRMATVGGAKVLQNERLGRIVPGYLADIAAVRIQNNPSMFPIFDPINSLVFHGSGRDVCLTIVNGKVVYRDGRYTTIDVPRAMGNLQELCGKINQMRKTWKPVPKRRFAQAQGS